ncbi:MAG TPA: hypothetical protein PKA58_14560 [Polyangium sp.]|nr:hypothetical protein [Polyangium sp.]
MRIAFRFLTFIITLIVTTFPLGCSDPQSSNTGDVIIGVTSTLRVGVDVLKLHVIKKVNGQTQSEEDLFSDGPTPFTLPLEIPFTSLTEGNDVEVEIEAFGMSSTALLTRKAATTVVANRKMLLRVDLSSACIGAQAPQCSDTQTCTGGVCGSTYVHPGLVENYWPDWSQGPTDVCKPNDGPPIVLVGKGMSDYLPVNDYDVAQVEAGPQGGHHIWVALRMKNLRQSGSITKLEGRIKELSTDVSPFSVIFTFDPAEGGYCKLYGLRFQLDGALNIDDVLGKTLLITATVKDKDGDTGVGTKWVKLSDTTL